MRVLSVTWKLSGHSRTLPALIPLERRPPHHKMNTFYAVFLLLNEIRLKARLEQRRAEKKVEDEQRELDREKERRESARLLQEAQKKREDELRAREMQQAREQKHKDAKYQEQLRCVLWIFRSPLLFYSLRDLIQFCMYVECN